MPLPLPLVPVIAALAAGGTLVPHTAGGMIVTSASGYIAGTYLTVYIQLFRDGADPPPIYEVVVGKLKT